MLMNHVRRLFPVLVVAVVCAAWGLVQVSAQEATPAEPVTLSDAFTRENQEVSFPVALSEGGQFVLVVDTSAFAFLTLTSPSGDEIINSSTGRLFLSPNVSLTMPVIAPESGEYVLTLLSGVVSEETTVTARVIPMEAVPEIELNTIYEESLGQNSANLYAVQVQQGDLLNPQVFTRNFDASVRIGMQRTPSTGFDGLTEFENFFLLRTAPYRVPEDGLAIVAVYSRVYGQSGNYVFGVMRPEGLPVLADDGTPRAGALNNDNQLFEQARFEAVAGDLYALTITSEITPSYQVEVTSPSNTLVAQTNPFTAGVENPETVTIPLLPILESGEFIATIHPSGTAEILEGGYALVLTRVTPPEIDDDLVIMLSSAYDQAFGAASFEGEADVPVTITLTSLTGQDINPAVRAYQAGELLLEHLPTSEVAASEIVLTVTPDSDGPVTLIFSQDGYRPQSGTRWEISLSAE
ncbi:MAG: hypothetical protein KME04_17245 [Pleurocapsa minor GSE-CHR-MK-17-07R]|jgi:hypothetical protein|nr:hypothetical protein [Pleurocapsa minor GSE-CHR-MK 17-07R]